MVFCIVLSSESMEFIAVLVFSMFPFKSNVSINFSHTHFATLLDIYCNIINKVPQVFIVLGLSAALELYVVGKQGRGRIDDCLLLC